MRRLFLFCALALASLAAACHPTANEAARPPLWRVTDGDTTIWLLGSIHMLPPGIEWQDDAVKQAIRESDALVLEIPPTDPAQASAAFVHAARAKAAVPIEERLPSPKRMLLADAIDHSHASRETLDGMKDWGAALVLAAGDASADGASRENGVEAVLTREFQEKGKPVEGLETLNGQFAIFDSLPARDQRHLLSNAVTDAAQPDGGYADALTAWRKGDASALASAADALFTAAPALKSALLVRRNTAWVADLTRRMKQHRGSLLVAVGSGHLVGPQGLPAMLGKAGFKVARVQ